MCLSPKRLSWFVAPCVGAWIETTEIEEVIDRAMVAPCVGAWIETEKSTILG